MSSTLHTGEASTTTDRRVHVRQTIRSFANLNLGSTNGGVVLDISEGGLALTSDAKLIRDSVLPMRFELPMIQKPIEAHGRVIWLNQSKKVAGIKFEDVPDDSRQKIREWISTQQWVYRKTRENSARDRKNPEPTSASDPAELQEVASAASNWFANPGSIEPPPPNTTVPQPFEAPIEITRGISDHERALQQDAEEEDAEEEDAEGSTVPSRRQSNRRLHPRQFVSALASYVDLGPDNGGMAVNVSEGGLALTALGKLVGGQLVQLRFQLPELEDWVEATGRIVWLGESKKEGGVKFEPLSADALTKIRGWLSTQGGNEPPREAPAQEPDWLAALRSPAQPSASPLPDPLAAREEREAPAQRVDWRAALRSPAQPSASSFPDPLAAREEREAPAQRVDWRAALHSPAQPSVSPLPGSRVAREERQAALERSRQAEGGQTSELRWNRLAAIGAVVALLSFGTGIFIDRHFSQRSATTAVNVAQQGQGINSSAQAPENGASASTQAPSQADTGSSERSVSPSNSNSRPPDSEGLVDKGLNPAARERQGQHGVRQQQRPPAHEVTNKHPGDKPSVTDRHKTTPALPPVTLARPTTPPETASPVREAVPPQITDTTPHSGTALSSKAAPVVNPNQPVSLPRPTDGAASAASSGLVTINIPPFPSIRVPPQLKSDLSRPGTELQMAQLVSRVEVVYPPEAIRQRIEGTVKLRALIGRDGVVSVAATGPPLLRDAAASAVRQWRYKPTVLGGQAVEAEEDIIVVFRLPSPVSK